MTTDSDRLTPGTLVDGRYEIRGLLGEGGMGTVYRARDTKMGQTVALKMLLQSGKGDRSREERRRRFMNEIYAINEVAHRNVVQVLEFGFFKDTPFMVMELLKGRDLSRVMRDSAGLLSVEYCVDVMLVVCAAIEACHHKGIIHRDLKPGNIMVIETDSGPGWDVKVLDFSISSVSKMAGDLTRDGQILGTPRFLSPEQVEGKVLPASDQYAIGLLLYVCLTKKHPLSDLDGLPLIRAIERGDIPRPRSVRPEIPEALEDVIMTAIRVDPGQRFARVHDLGRALWPFGSQLGQGVWKKYYFETPRPQSPQGTAKMSTTGIPLVLKMAKGDVPMNSETAVAHYQSTTAIPVTGTLDDPDAPATAEAEGPGQSASGRTVLDPQSGPIKADAPSAPSEWNWQSSSSESASSVSLVGESPRKRRKVIAGALFVVATISIAAVVGIGRAGRNTTDARHAGPTATSASAVAAPTAQGDPVGSPPLKSPRATSARADAPAPLGSGGMPEGQQRQAAKRTERQRSDAKRAEADWEVDAAGIPILPAAGAAPDTRRGQDAQRRKHRDHASAKRKQPSADWEVDANGAPIPPL